MDHYDKLNFWNAPRLKSFQKPSLIVIALFVVSVIPSSIVPAEAATNEPLQPMTTNKVFNTFAFCFQNQCSGAVRYLFKPTGFATWHNVGAGNVTLTGFTIGGQSRSVSAFSNSTTIDYRISVPNVVTMDVYFKEKPTNGRPSNIFKVTMIGTSSVSGTFTWNFGNPQSFPVTCDNTKHLLTYGTAGLNFTDATNFSATCTATTVSFTVGVGAFRIDPSTVSAVTIASAIRAEYQNKAWWVPALSMFAAFYSDGTNPKCRTSSDGQTWSSAATLGGGAGGSAIDYWFSGSTLYYVRVSGNTFLWRYGTFSSGCSMTWTISEASVSTTGTTPGAPSIVIDPSSNLWVAVATTQSAQTHTEVWECAGAVSSCTWTKSLDNNYGSAPGNFQTMMVADSTFIGVIFGSSNGGSKASIVYSTNSGSTWSSVFTQSSGTLGSTQTSHAIALSSKIWLSGTVCNGGGGGCYQTFNTSTNTFSATTVLFASGVHAIITTDSTNLFFITASASQINIYQSFDAGSSFSSAIVLAASQSLAGASLTSASIVGNSIGIEWENGALNAILYQTFDTNVPQIIQSTSCTFTGSSGNCAFASNTKANDNAVVIVGNIASTTVSTVTDTQSLTYTLLVSKDAGTIGDIEGWCAAPTGAAADTITVSYGISVTATIILYELSTPRCDPLTSTGTGTAVTSASVSSFTPTANAFVIGGLDSTCQVACTVTAGSGYSLDKTVNTGAANTVDTEYFWNVAQPDTAPFTFSAASSYNEISMAFTRSVTVSTSAAFSASAVFKQSVGKNPSSSFVLSPVFSPALVLSRAFSAAFSASAKFNQGLNLHPFLPTLSFSSLFDFSKGQVQVIPVQNLDVFSIIAMFVAFMTLIIVVGKKKRRR